MTETLQIDFPPAIPVETERRIRAARASGKLSECQADVLRLLTHGLRPALGVGSALRILDMQWAWRDRHERVWSDRMVKQAVKDLLEIHGIAIGSSRSSDCPGFYLIENDAEVQATVRVWLSQAVKMIHRCKLLSPDTDFVQMLNGQQALSMEREA